MLTQAPPSYEPGRIKRKDMTPAAATTSYSRAAAPVMRPARGAAGLRPGSGVLSTSGCAPAAACPLTKQWAAPRLHQPIAGLCLPGCVGSYWHSRGRGASLKARCIPPANETVTAMVACAESDVTVTDRQTASDVQPEPEQQPAIDAAGPLLRPTMPTAALAAPSQAIAIGAAAAGAAFSGRADADASSTADARNSHGESRTAISLDAVVTTATAATLAAASPAAASADAVAPAEANAAPSVPSTAASAAAAAGSDGADARMWPLFVLALSYAHCASTSFALPVLLPMIRTELSLSDLQVRALLSCCAV